jgi:hypothetical protein
VLETAFHRKEANQAEIPARRACQSEAVRDRTYEEVGHDTRTTRTVADQFVWRGGIPRAYLKGSTTKRSYN